VKFKSGVTTSQINEFIQEMGTTGRPDVYTPGLWIVRYPVGSATPPLQVGVDVSANPLVDWADSDRTETGCPELF
jgi:hypothetical protein